jgi:hypothetical protein
MSTALATPRAFASTGASPARISASGAMRCGVSKQDTAGARERARELFLRGGRHGIARVRAHRFAQHTLRVGARAAGTQQPRVLRGSLGFVVVCTGHVGRKA